MQHRITPETLEILTLLARYRYLRKSFLDGLLPHRSKQGMNRTLKRVREAGYVALPRAQYRGYNNLYCCYIYEITPRGWSLLRSRDIPQVTSLLRVKQDAPTRQFAHAMMICDALASLEIGIREAGHSFIPVDEILDRCNASEPLKLTCRVRGRDEKLVPDGLFGVRRDGKAHFYVLEAEHYNPVWPTRDLARASFRKKAYGYDHIAAHRPYQRQLRIPNLSYLFVFPTRARSETAAAHMASELAGTRFAERAHLADIPVQEELLQAPPPFPSLYASPWLGNGRIDRD